MEKGRAPTLSMEKGRVSMENGRAATAAHGAASGGGPTGGKGELVPSSAGGCQEPQARAEWGKHAMLERCPAGGGGTKECGKAPTAIAVARSPEREC